MSLAVREQALGQGLRGRGLITTVDGRVDTKAGFICQGTVAGKHVLAHHLTDIWRVNFNFLTMSVSGQRGCRGLFECGVVDQVQPLHAAQHIVAPLKRPGWVAYRIDA